MSSFEFLVEFVTEGTIASRNKLQRSLHCSSEVLNLLLRNFVMPFLNVASKLANGAKSRVLANKTAPLKPILIMW
jgi:hypothetical protein